MFLGHFAVALSAKKVAPHASLGTLFLAAQFADLLWPIFLLAGWEQVRIVPGITRVTPFDFIWYPYSHSLIAQLLWGTLLGLAYFLIRRHARTAVVLALCVPSHWVLDTIVHRPDLPIVPGGTRYGLGLWNSLPVTLLLELSLFGIGIVVYMSAGHAKDHSGRYVIGSLLGFLLLTFAGSIFGPPPPSVAVLEWSALFIWLLVPWASWADRRRSSIVETT